MYSDLSKETAIALVKFFEAIEPSWARSSITIRKYDDRPFSQIEEEAYVLINALNIPLPEIYGMIKVLNAIGYMITPTLGRNDPVVTLLCSIVACSIRYLLFYGFDMTPITNTYSETEGE